MTPSDLITTLLMAELTHLKDVGLDKHDFTIGGKSFHAHPAYKSIWRYPYVRPFDIGAIVLRDERVLVLYEGEEPNHSRWENYCVFNDPKDAWIFIRDFLQEHPQ